jgi:transposase
MKVTSSLPLAVGFPWVVSRSLLEQVESQAEIAETFGVGQSTVEKWWRRWREPGCCAARPHAGGMERTARWSLPWAWRA